MTYPSGFWVNPKIELRASSIHGRGMFATAPIEPGETVTIWGGRFVSTEQEAEAASKKGELVTRLDEDLYSVEQRGENETYFINHSCDSNVWMANAWTLAARMAILLGQELTIDYALFESDEAAAYSWTCNCGSPSCRSGVTGMDWRRPEVQRRYADHFSPFLNKRIGQLKTAPCAVGMTPFLRAPLAFRGGL